MMLKRFLYKLTGLLIVPFLLGSCATIAGVDESGPEPKSERTFPYDRFVEGKPNLDMRVEGGCYIWRDGNNWHVRVAKIIDRPRTLSITGPVITGKIRVKQGLIVNFSKQNIIIPNDARFVRNNITFKFEMRNDTGDNIEGFDFTIKPTGIDYCLTFDFLTDGVPTPGIIHLGSFLHIPEEMPLKVCLHSFD